MNNNNYKVNISEEVNNFIGSLGPAMAAKARRTIELLQEHGPLLKRPFVEKVNPWDIWALRFNKGTDNVRLFYFHLTDSGYMIIHGYVKKDNKIDKNQIKIALQIKRETVESHGGEKQHRRKTYSKKKGKK